MVDFVPKPSTVELSREVIATTIPYGQKTTLPKGAKVEITQDRGNITVMTDIGFLLIESKDADALGFEPRDTSLYAEGIGNLETTATRVWDQLKTCYDPEISVNIVELGLIYENKVEPFENGFKVSIQMTLTAPGCGMGAVIQQEAQEKILKIPGIRECNVELVWDPPWDQSRMTEEARLQLGFF